MQPEIYYQQGKTYTAQKLFDKARKAFLLAADGGHAKAECYVGLMYLHGQNNFSQDKQAAYQWLFKSVQHGFSRPDLEYNLGRMLEKGEGVASDLRAAVFWYQCAAAHTEEDPSTQAIVKLAQDKCVKFATIQPSFPLFAYAPAPTVEDYYLSAAAARSTGEARLIKQADLRFNKAELGSHLLGEGSYGQVYALHVKFPHVIGAPALAVKAIPLPQAGRAWLLNELNILENLQAPGIAAFYGKFEVDNTLYLILELVVCSLNKLIVGLPTPYVLQILLEIAQALILLHTNNIVHGDLNPRHVLIGQDLHVRLSNFNNIKTQTLQTSTGDFFSSTDNIGTLDYTPPEAFTPGIKLTPAADWYAFGLIVWSLVKQAMLYSDQSPAQILRIRTAGTECATLLEALPPDCLAVFSRLLQSCCAHKTEERQTGSQICAGLREETEKHPMTQEVLQQVFTGAKAQIQPPHQKFYPAFYN